MAVLNKADNAFTQIKRIDFGIANHRLMTEVNRNAPLSGIPLDSS